MAQSLVNILVHLIFSTKERRPLIDGEIETDLYRYITAVCATCQCPAHQIGGTEDHVHILLSLLPTITVSHLVEEAKKRSAKWASTKGQQYEDFAWQGGYGAFSIGQSQLETVKKYIADQKQHHKARSFQDEFRAFLDRYQVEYDERYVWD